MHTLSYFPLYLLSVLSFQGTEAAPSQCLDQTPIVAPLSPVAQGELLNSEILSIIAELDPLKQLLNYGNVIVSGNTVAFPVNRTSDTYEVIYSEHQNDTSYDSPTLEASFVQRSKELWNEYIPIISGLLTKNGWGNPAHNQFTYSDIRKIKAAMFHTQPLVKQLYSIFANVLTGENKNSVAKDGNGIDGNFKGFRLNFK